MVSKGGIPDEQIKADILHKLFRKKKWGASHTALQNLHKWCKPEFAERYRNIAELLMKEGFLIPKPTHYGLQVSLNPRKRNEIIQIILKFFRNN